MPREIVIVGGGIAGVRAARRLSHTNSVTLIEPKHTLTYSPLLRDYALGHIPERLVDHPYHRVLKNVRHIHGTAEAFDFRTRKIRARSNDQSTTISVPYEYCIIATDPRAHEFEDALNAYSHEDIRRLRRALKRIVWKRTPASLGIIGAGPHGIEFALGLSQFFTHHGVRGNITLYEREPTILPRYNERIARAARAHLIFAGIRIRNAHATSVESTDSKRKIYLQENGKISMETHDEIISCAGTTPNTPSTDERLSLRELSS